MLKIWAKPRFSTKKTARSIRFLRGEIPRFYTIKLRFLMMIDWREVPFVRLLLPFALGIVAREYGLALPQFWVNLLLGVSLLSMVIFSLQRVKFRQRWVFGIPLSIFLFLTGCQAVFYNNELNEAHHFQQFLSPHQQTEQLCLATVTDFSERPNNYRLTVSLNKIGAVPNSTPDSMHHCTGNLLMYIRKDSTLKTPPQYGDLILLKSKIRLTESPKNPDAFDFKQYLHRQNIHHQAFVAMGNIQILAERRGNPIQQLATDCQKYLLTILKKHLTTEQEFAVGGALLLGYRDAVDEDVRNAYVQTGAMHILAISGMHIVLIFQGLQWVFSVYKSGNRRFRWTKIIVSLVLIWFFSLIAGLGASILRAAIMATFLTIGQTMKRKGNIYNILTASAFVLLLWQPLFLFDVGCQLSYFAVVGIVYFYPKIQKIIISKHKIINYIWDGLSIGFAAQLVVTPISIYYFHQFPTYFWLSGLLVVPLSNGAIYIGIGLFLFDKLPVIGYTLGKILLGCLFLMNKILLIIQTFPHRIVDKLSFSLITLLLSYLALIHIAVAIQSRQLRTFFTPLSIFIILSSVYAFSTIQHTQQKRIIIYNVYKHTLIDFVEGTTCFSFTEADSNAVNIQNKIEYAADNHRIKLKINEIHTSNLYNTLKNPHFNYLKGLVQFDSFRLAILDKLPEKPIDLPFDAVLIRNNPGFSMEELRQKIQFRQVIMDASNSLRNVDMWKNMCITIGMSFYDTNVSGAWSKDF
ncbi:MAG: ComEC/Rec2 family competence protein [Saprospiraceae bacterium]|nr:ComEC/Rec2 family competence protein [Saprospiraceae bacterium]